MMKNFELMLQLFAEAAAGDTAHFTGENEAAAAPQATGETLASAAGVQNDRSSAFEALIKGEFKQEYNTRLQDTLQKRLKGHKELVQKMEALTPALEKIARRHGVDPTDIPALTQVLDRVQTPPSPQVRARQQADRWSMQALQTKQMYAGFDLAGALKNPQFTKLLKADVDMKTAYEVLHGRDHFSQALAYATLQMEKSLAQKISAAQSRPVENGIGAGSAAVVKNDVSQMSRQDRADIIRRVRKGETIRF